MQQIREKMDLIDLDEDTIDAEVLGLSRCYHGQLPIRIGHLLIPLLSGKLLSRYLPSLGTTLVVWRRSSRSSRRPFSTQWIIPRSLSSRHVAIEGCLVLWSARYW